MLSQLALSAPDYRFRVPWQHQAFLLAGVLSSIPGLLLIRGDHGFWGSILLVTAGLAALQGLALLLIINRRGRERARQQMVDCIRWGGGEQVLDVGWEMGW